MSGFYWLDEPFEDGRVPTAADLERATPLPVTSWSGDDSVEVVDEEHDLPTTDRERLVNPDGSLNVPAVNRRVAEINAVPVGLDTRLASGGLVSPAVGLTAAMRRCGLELTPWQQRAAATLLAARRPVITYPKQSGRRSISRVVSAAMNGAPVPLSRELTLTLTADVSGFSSAIRAAAEAADRAARSVARFDVAWWTTDEPLSVVAKRRRRRSVEQRRIRQAMRHVARRAARRQRRAAARGVTR